MNKAEVSKEFIGKLKELFQAYGCQIWEADAYEWNGVDEIKVPGPIMLTPEGGEDIDFWSEVYEE